MKPLRYISRWLRHRLRKRVTALVKPYSCGVFFIYHSLMIIIPCFDNFVNGKGTKNYSKNADFFSSYIVQNIYKTLSDFFFLKAILRRNKKTPSAGATALTEGVFVTLCQIVTDSFRIFHHSQK